MPLIRRRALRRARHAWLFGCATSIDRGELLLSLWLAMPWAVA